MLVEKSINSSLGNRAYSEKRPIYLQSKLLLTRALSERPQVGANTRIDHAVESIESVPTWMECDVLRRQRWLADLSRAVWRIPASSAAPS